MENIKKISLISIGAAAGLAIMLLLTFLLFIPNGRQNSIQDLINSGKYEEAMALINQNGSFGDTENLKAMCSAGECFDNLDYETGIDYIYNIGGTVDVTYDTDGGTASSNGVQIKKAYINNDASKKGYDFNGWALNSYSLDAKNHKATLNLKAQYDIVTYSITYDLGGGTASKLPNQYTVEQNIIINNAYRDGYRFLGWTSEDLTTPSTYPVLSGDVGDKFFTANWQAIQYTIHLDANGGTVSSTELKVTFDQPFTLPIPTYNGYEFRGWFIDGRSIKFEDGIYVTASDSYLGAKWSAINYAINYNLDGGTNNPNNPTSYTIEDADFTLQDPTRDGYTFIGWTSSDISTPTKNVQIAQGSTGEKTYTANWTVNP